jgi:hypothetical protein
MTQPLKIFQRITQTEGSLPYLQKPTNYPKPNLPNTAHTNMPHSFNDRFNIILSSTVRYFKMFFPSLSLIKSVYSQDYNMKY